MVFLLSAVVDFLLIGIFLVVIFFSFIRLWIQSLLTGAKISIYAAGTNQLLWYEQVADYDFQVATSYYSYGQAERHFGLGTRTNVDVVVQFASGRVTRLNNVSANQTIDVLESAGV